MMTIAISCFILAAVAFALAKAQPRSREVFVSTKAEQLPDGSTREVQERSSSASWGQMDIRDKAIRNHRIAMLVATVAALAGIGLGIAARIRG